MTGGWRVPGGSASVALLVLALVPFEPRRPTASAWGFEFTLLEMAVGLALLVLLVTGRQRVAEGLRHPPAPVAALAAFAAAHLLSAAWAPANRDLAARFALRMVAAAVFAFAVSLAPADARRRGLLALVGGAAAVAVLAVLEWYPVRGLRPFLDLFREAWFVVGSTRRVTAGSEYPNLAAAFLMYGLVAAAALVPDPRQGFVFGGASRSALAGFVLFPLLSLGLILTYSRGPLLAAVLGLVAVAVVRRHQDGSLVPASSLATLAAILAVGGWFEPALRVRFSSQGTEGWYGVRYELAEKSLRLNPGQRTRVVVRVANTGRDTWKKGESFALGHRWHRARDGGEMSHHFGAPLAQDVPPGGRTVVAVDVEAPSATGRYALVFDLVQGHLGWLSGLGSPPGTLGVEVGTPTDPPAAVSFTEESTNVDPKWEPGRRELSRLALAMWRSHPLLGVGSDNFRWLHGAFAGRSDNDSRTFSNNTFLEAASTTGSVGLLAFLATVVSALSSALRAAGGRGARSAASPFAVGVLGLLVAVTVHGLMDYVLAFTGHYVVFAFLIGSSAAAVRDDTTPGVQVHE